MRENSLDAELDEELEASKEEAKAPIEKMEQAGSAKPPIAVFVVICVVVLAVGAYFLFGSEDEDTESTELGAIPVQLEAEMDDSSDSASGELVIPEFEEEDLTRKLREKNDADDGVQASKNLFERDLSKKDYKIVEKGVLARQFEDASQKVEEKKQRLNAHQEINAEAFKRQTHAYGSQSDSGGSSLSQFLPGGSGFGAGSGGRGGRFDAQRQGIEQQKGEIAQLLKTATNGLGRSGAPRQLPTIRKADAEGASPIEGLLALPESQHTTLQASVLQDSDWLVAEGSVIQATLETAIDSNLPGKVRAVLNSPVYSFTGNLLILPRFTRLIGEYSGGSLGGEPRIFVIWTRLITPDGITINLDSPGIDTLGRSGVSGWTDTHFFKRFGASVMLSLIGGWAQNEADSNAQSEAYANSFNKSAEIALESSVNLGPTIKINQGERLGVFVNSDLNFKLAYQSINKTPLTSHRLKPKPRQTFDYERVFKDTPLTQEERLRLANRFIKEGHSLEQERVIKRAFVAQQGESLRGVLTRWSSIVDYKLAWDVFHPETFDLLDWRIPTEMAFHSSYYESVNSLMFAYQQTGVDLVHRFYKENNVLSVKLGRGGLSDE